MRVCPCRTNDPAFFDGDEIDAFESLVAIDFKASQIFIVDFFDAAETIGNRKMLFLLRLG